MTNQGENTLDQGIAINQGAIKINHQRCVFLCAACCRGNGRGHFILRMLEIWMIHLQDSPNAGGTQGCPWRLRNDRSCAGAALGCASHASLLPERMLELRSIPLTGPQNDLLPTSPSSRFKLA